MNDNAEYFVKKYFKCFFPIVIIRTHITNHHNSIISNIYTDSINDDITSGAISADISDTFPPKIPNNIVIIEKK